MKPELRHVILTDAGHQCDTCKGVDFSGRQLEVHHRDRNRKNNTPDNLQVLCCTCHYHVHRGDTWSDELNAFDTPWAREQVALAKRWESGMKETITITLDSLVLKELHLLASQCNGHGDIGRYLSEWRWRQRPSDLIGEAA